jgi:hypothetical protein
MGRRPKTYTFHSRKARFNVYCTSTNQQHPLLQHVLKVESGDSLRCAIVAPVISSSGEQRASTSANRKANSLLVPELYPLAKLGKRRARRDDSDSEDENTTSIALGSEDSSSDEDESDSDSDYVDEEESQDENPQRPTSRPTRNSSAPDGEAVSRDDEDECKRADLYGYRIFLEYDTAPARSSRAWGTALFEGFDKAQALESSTPLPTSAFPEEQDHYIVDLLLVPAAALHGSPTLDEHATLRLVSERYSVRTDQDKVINDIRLYCRGRAAVQPTFDRIKKHWRQAKEIPITPRVLHVQDAVYPRLIAPHPFYPHKILDGWAERFVGLDKVLTTRLAYEPLVLTSKLGRFGKTWWARSLGRHIHVLGALDNEVIHAGIMKGADVLILDNVKWHVLFNSDLGRALCERQDKIKWIRRGGERVTTYLTIPVIILNNKKCKTWGQNSKKYWKTHMQWVRVRKVMYDESKLVVTDTASVALPVSSTSSSSSLPITSSSSPSQSSPSSSSPSSSPSLSPSPSPVLSSSLASPAPSLSPPCSPVLAAQQQVPGGFSLTSIPTELMPIIPPVFDMRYIQSRFPNAVFFGENGGSCYIPNAVNKEEADSMRVSVRPELEPLYVRRDGPTVQVPMYKKKRGVSRDKAALSDAAGSLRTLYRYGAPELAQTRPFSMSPTVLRGRDLIYERLGVRCNHCIPNRYKGQQGVKGEKRDGIGSHQDKDRDFPVGGPIVTLTLCEPGGERTLEVTKWEHTGETKRQFNKKKQEWVNKPVKSCLHTQRIVMEHGSLTIIDWDSNHRWGKEKNGRVWKHEVLQAKGECGERFGLTYRCIGTVWDINTGEIVNAKAKREQAVPLAIVDKAGVVVSRNQQEDPRWSMSSKPTTEDLVNVAVDDDEVDDEGEAEEEDDAVSDEDDEQTETTPVKAQRKGKGRGAKRKAV